MSKNKSELRELKSHQESVDIPDDALINALRTEVEGSPVTIKLPLPDATGGYLRGGHERGATWDMVETKIRRLAEEQKQDGLQRLSFQSAPPGDGDPTAEREEHLHDVTPQPAQGQRGGPMGIPKDPFVPVIKKQVIDKVNSQWVMTEGPRYRRPDKSKVERIVAVNTPSEKEDIADLRESLVIDKLSTSTFVFAVAVAKKQENNHVISIPCYHAVAFGGYPHDRANDSYLVSGLEYLSVGEFPFGFQISLPSAGTWSVPVPIPCPVLERAMSPQQRRMVQDFSDRFSKEEHEIIFVQMQSCN